MVLFVSLCTNSLELNFSLNDKRVAVESIFKQNSKLKIHFTTDTVNEFILTFKSCKYLILKEAFK